MNCINTEANIPLFLQPSENVMNLKPFMYTNRKDITIVPDNQSVRDFVDEIKNNPLAQARASFVPVMLQLLSLVI